MLEMEYRAAAVEQKLNNMRPVDTDWIVTPVQGTGGLRLKIVIPSVEWITPVLDDESVAGMVEEVAVLLEDWARQVREIAQ